MKAYTKNGRGKFDYPDEMRLILEYLNKNGKINVTENRVEELYREFSEDTYCAGWMGIKDNEHLLEGFANWLAQKDI